MIFDVKLSRFAGIVNIDSILKLDSLEFWAHCRSNLYLVGSSSMRFRCRSTAVAWVEHCVDWMASDIARVWLSKLVS